MTFRRWAASLEWKTKMHGDASALSPQEGRLLEAARSGDRDAFALLLRETTPTLERLALRMVGDRHDAEDVAQDAVLTAWRKLSTFQGRSRFKTWVCRIVVHRSLDFLRRRRPRTELAADSAAVLDSDPAALAQDRELEGIVRGAIEKLPPVQRATLLLRVDQGLPYEEIAYVMGSSRNSVRANLIAARKRLAVELDGKVDLR